MREHADLNVRPARQHLVDALNEEHNPSYWGGVHRDAEALVDAFAHELAEMIRKEARQGYGEKQPGTTYYEGEAALWAAVIIDPDLALLTSGLTEFLRDRYDELQEQAETVHDAGCDGTAPGGGCACGSPQAAIAALDCKVAIVNAYEEAAAWYVTPDYQNCPAGELRRLQEAVRLLARPFAGHPDFPDQRRSDGSA